MSALIKAALTRRAAAAAGEHGLAGDVARGHPEQRRSHADAPADARPPVAFRAEIRAKVEGDTAEVDGYASVTESPYEMWDWAGPYAEVISRGAFGKTLAEGADVAFLLNHGGMTLARTKSGTLTLSEDDTGLRSVAQIDTRMGAARDMALAIERGDLTEMSFAFRIVRGQWSPDYSEYRIDEVSLAKGDVSVVNYGANPATSVALREADVPPARRSYAAERMRLLAPAPRLLVP